MPTKIKCCICETEYTGSFFDECPCCLWAYTGEEEIFEETEEDAYNLVSRKIARENYSKGLNIWGEPLPKIRPKTK